MTDTVVNLRRSTSPARTPAPVSFSPADLASINAGFEAATATEIVAWAVEQFHPALSLASSMTDAVLIDLAWRVEPSIEVVFIDTGYHFPETLQTLEQVRRHYGLNLKVMTVAAHDQELWRIDPENCCSSVKVGQLDRALAGRAAWMSGLRRAESPSRAGAPLVANDVRGLVKINPLATWDDDDVARYIADHSVPVNPLLEQGYHSIGCAPCTAPVLDGAGPRSGRWSESDKSECGLHL
ncbi:MAG: phosphoadenylyl-sulfate reductase [Actinomycetota bacterium]|nr:phosphoadenylyl-sulfate reductase [Actinomycetota bacterium]